MRTIPLRHAIRRMLLEAEGFNSEALKTARSYFMRFIPARGDKQMLMAATIALALGDETKFVNRLASSFPGTASVATGARGAWSAEIDPEAARKYIMSLQSPMTNVGRGDLFNKVLRTFEGSLRNTAIGDISLSDEENAILDAWNAQSVSGGKGESAGTTGTGAGEGIQDESSPQSPDLGEEGDPSSRDLSEVEAWMNSCAGIINDSILKAVVNLPGRNAINNMEIDLKVGPSGGVEKVLLVRSSRRTSLDEAVMASLPKNLPVPPASYIEVIKRDPEACLEFNPSFDPGN